MKLLNLVNLYKKEGYDEIDANAKVCQDIVLLKISKSPLSKNVTIKGGVVMHSISNDKRRATRDLDLDFIKYSLEDESIRKFIEKLNDNDISIKIEITGKIEPLHHQDYDGKRVYVKLYDDTGFSISTKLDIGVHKQFDIEQDEYCFEIGTINESAKLLINSKEQIIVEKLKSLLKFGYVSTRYKDIFDFYYLINNCNLNKDKMLEIIKILIIDDNSVKEENIEEIVITLKKVLNNKRYLRNLNTAKINWLELPIDEVVESVLNYFENLLKVGV